ncbi:hypothetical protein T484DRAFT_2654155 [Baffinella frigidus]|nr:hypothetical protein T484DRAFT_2654155 [Cryptophyta sp. CCMP2293]
MGGLKLGGVLLVVFLVGTGAFHTPYRPEKSRHFDASKSSSFSAITDKVFDLHYADGSHLRGFNGVDQIWVSALPFPLASWAESR